MPYWIESTLLPTPALIWLFLGLGIPWSLVILPRRDWSDRVMVACLTLAIGPALLTAWMFVLGSIQGQTLLRQDTIVLGMAVLAVVGWIWAWRKWVKPFGDVGTRYIVSLRTDEKLLIGLVIVALVIRWLGVAYWPSTAYDAQWVYAYEGKLYTLLGFIPQKIAYYPQFLPLLHTYLQIMVGGINDHAARAILPFLHVGSILAAYVMGNRLFNRRVGIFAAAIWALYPHVGEWSRYGDLEIPLTFMFTMAATFFVMAWEKIEPQRRREHREDQTQDVHPYRRYAFIAGIFLGIGMWTKPTMGAFIWGVTLVFAVMVGKIWWERRNGRGGKDGQVSALSLQGAIRPYIEVVVITGLASIPLGAVWYVRNLALGYPAIDFPSDFWPTLAARSGVELGWPLLAMVVLLAWVWFIEKSKVQSQKLEQASSALQIRGLLIGIGLLLVGVLPSIINSGRVSVNDDRMGLLEWLAVGGGALVLYITLSSWAKNRWTGEGRDTAGKIGWLLLLALPYFVTWFYSYSYHYRLSFAIVPLLIMPTAVILARWTEKVTSHLSPATSEKIRYKGTLRVWYGLVIVGLAIPGIIAPLYDPNAGWDWLWTDKLLDDHARYTSGNAGMMAVVDGLQTYLDQHDTPLHVVAPGIKRLPFFFPLEDIRVDTLPTRLDQLEGITYFIYGTPESGGGLDHLVPGENQVLSALSVATDDMNDSGAIMRRAWGYDDGIFKFTVYELQLENRFKKPSPDAPPLDGDVVFGGFVRYLGQNIGGDMLWPGRKILLHLYWEVLVPPPADYIVYIHLMDEQGNLLETWDGPITRTQDGNYYSSLVWEPGEYIADQRRLMLNYPDTPVGENYRIVVGFYDVATEQRVPVTINGEPAGDSYTIKNNMRVVAEAPG